MPHYSINTINKDLDFPNQCPCCGGIPDTFYNIAKPESNDNSTADSKFWKIPYCSNCLNHIKEYKKSRKILNWGILLSVFTASFTLQFYAIPGLIVFIISAIFSSKQLTKAKSLTQSACSSQSEAIVYNGWNGREHRFTFTNKEYSELFILYNNDKLKSNIVENKYAIANTNNDRNIILNIEKEILSAAKKNYGVLTPIKLTLASNLTIKEADTILKDFSNKGFCQIEIDSDGKVEYHFSDFKNS